MKKLKFYLKGSKKTYTLKDAINNKPTLSAHYKFVKLPNVSEKA